MPVHSQSFWTPEDVSVHSQSFRTPENVSACPQSVLQDTGERQCLSTVLTNSVIAAFVIPFGDSGACLTHEITASMTLTIIPVIMRL